MEDLNYAFSVAFSGSDLDRALWIGLVGSLLCSSRLPPLRVWLVGILIDRSWPFISMGFAGYGAGEVAAAFAHWFRSLPDDALPLLVRAGGIYFMVMGGYWARLSLHGVKPTLRPRKATLPY